LLLTGALGIVTDQAKYYDYPRFDLLPREAQMREVNTNRVAGV